MSIEESIDSVFQSERIEIEWRKSESIVVGKYEIKTVTDYLLIIVDSRVIRQFSVRRTRLEEHPRRIDVFKPVEIVVSNTGEKKNVETFVVREGFILNNYVVKFRQHREFNLHTVHFIQCGPCDAIYFVFDIEDTRKKYADASNQLLSYLPPELVIQVAEHLGTTKSDFTDDSEYSEKDFPFDFKPKYKYQSIPKKLTKSQLQKLYQLGVLQVGYDTEDSIDLFSEAAYDHVYPNNKQNRWKKMFPIKQDFLGYLEDLKSKIDRFFQS
jgi:hypothetical protein